MKRFCQIKSNDTGEFVDTDKPVLSDATAVLSCEWWDKPLMEFRGVPESLDDYVYSTTVRPCTHKSLKDIEWEKCEDGMSANEPFEFWFLFEGRLINFSHPKKTNVFDGYILSMTSLCAPVQTVMYGWMSGEEVK